MTTKFSSRENVKVVIRYRPVNKIERAHENDELKVEPMTWDEKQQNIVLGKKKNKIWGFDGVCGPEVDQEKMFNIVAEQTCRDVVNGYNGTIFVYGQTGSGKTYTMYGAEDKPNEIPLMGVIPRSVSYIFDAIAHDEDIDTYRVTVSFLEIYQEKPRDLLNEDKHQDLKIRLNKRHETYVQGLVEHQVESISDVLQLITIAVGNRVTDSTNMNAVSSRSHMLMRMTVVIKLKDGTIRIAGANFADLAGSEKVKKTGARGQRLNEAKSINKSLSVLGQVINALSSGKNRHVPFRDSMLTHVLRDSLGGNCKTTLVVTVSPHKYNRMETINSLRFGRRCKLVTNKASVNRVYSNDELMRRLAILEAKNGELQEMLKQKAFEAFQNSHVPKQIEGLQAELDEVKEKLSKTEAENDDLDKIIVGLRNEKMELEDKSATDREQIESLQQRISELEGVISSLREELEGYRERERQMTAAQKVMGDKLQSMEVENEERSAEINQLQNELTTLREFKHETQQQNIQNMMKQEEQTNEMNRIKQQMERQQLQFEQQLMSQQNETKSMEKELQMEQEKVTQLRTEQEKMEQEQNQDLHRRYSAALQNEQQRRVSNVERATTESKEAQNAQNEAADEEMTIEMFEKSQQQRLQKYEEKVRNEYERKEAELVARGEMMKSEMKQKLRIEIKNETDIEFNKKLKESQTQFAAQLVSLQDALTEAHDTANAQRVEIEEERRKYKELVRKDNVKSNEILAMEDERECAKKEFEQLKTQWMEERTRNANIGDRESEYKRAIEEYEEEKDKLLKERERLQQQLDEERSKIDEIREDFQRKAELFGAKEKQHLNLIKKSQQEKEAIKSQLSEHSRVLAKSNQLLDKQNKILKQRESKIYGLVEKQSRYLDSMNQLRTIQIGMDEDVAKRMLDEEAAAEQRRKKQLAEQRRKDEEYVRSLLLKEQKPGDEANAAKGGKAAKPKSNKSHSQLRMSKSKSMNNEDEELNNMEEADEQIVGRTASQSVAIHAHNQKQLKKRDKAHRDHNAAAQTDVEEMMKFANAQSKTNLSQQIASVALAQQRDRLMGGKAKKSVLDLWIKSQMQLMCGQLPTLCKKYGIKLNKLDDMYCDAKRNYQPQFDEKHYLKFRDANYDPKEFDAEYAARRKSKKHAANKQNNPLLPPEAADNEIFDPYGHYAAGNANNSNMRVAAKPQGFVAPAAENVSPNKKAKKSFGIFKKRKSKNKSNKNKKRSFNKKNGKKKSSKNENKYEADQFEFEVEDAPPPVPFGQYLNNMDLQQFEKIKIEKELLKKQSENNYNEEVELQLEEDINNMDRYRYPNANNNEKESSNESLDYDANDEKNGHHLAPTQDTVVVHDLSAQQSISYSRGDNVSISTMHAHDESSSFEAMTKMTRIGEMAGIYVSCQFGLCNNKKQLQQTIMIPMLRFTIKNGNLNGAPIHRLNLKFAPNCVGCSSSVSAIALTAGPIAHNDEFECNVPLLLNESDSIHRNVKQNDFSTSAQLIVTTNLFAIKCVVRVPIHLFFQNRGQLPRDQFLSLWKSIPSDKESKLQIRKARSSDMEHLKSLLQIHKLFFIHHRTIPNKGNILYYSAKMYGQVLLCEISIALSGKGTAVVRSNDRYKSILCVNAIKLLIDS